MLLSAWVPKYLVKFLTSVPLGMCPCPFDTPLSAISPFPLCYRQGFLNFCLPSLKACWTASICLPLTQCCHAWGWGRCSTLHLLWMLLACKTLSLILSLFASFLSLCTTHGGLFCVRHHPCLLTNLYFLNRFNFSSINSQNCSESSVFTFKKKQKKKQRNTFRLRKVVATHLHPSSDISFMYLCPACARKRLSG